MYTVLYSRYERLFVQRRHNVCRVVFAIRKTVCIAAAQCMPCCTRDTKDCLYSGGTMYTVLYSRYERLFVQRRHNVCRVVFAIRKTVCIAAAQCMPCCIRDTKDCLYSGGTMYAVLYSRYERLFVQRRHNVCRVVFAIRKTVCIAAAQCMPCCIRDTRDCLYSGGTMYAVLYSRNERLLRT